MEERRALWSSKKTRRDSPAMKRNREMKVVLPLPESEGSSVTVDVNSTRYVTIEWVGTPLPSITEESSASLELPCRKVMVKTIFFGG